MAKAKRADGAAARNMLSEAEMNLLMRLVEEERLYVVPATKAQKPRKVASASLTAGGRAVLLYQSKMPTELP
jgi:hypothetical protein